MTYQQPSAVYSRIEDRDGDGVMLAYSVPTFIVVVITFWLPLAIMFWF